MRYWEPPKKNRRTRRPSPPTKRSIASPGSLRNYPFLRKFYQHQAEISVGLQKFIFFLVLATLLYAFGLGDSGIIHIIQLKREKRTIEASLAKVDRDIATLKGEIGRLDTDPFAMEKLGRERYGYIYPGDRVYKIVHLPR